MPYPGIVVQRNVNRGDFVQPATMTTARPLFIVARSDLVRVFVEVPEMEAARIERGATGSVHVQALDGRTIEGTVTQTSWALGPNRTLRVELDIPNPKAILRPGMYVTAEIVLEQRPDVLALPLSAVFTIEKQTYCCCVEDGKIVRRPDNARLADRPRGGGNVGSQGRRNGRPSPGRPSSPGSACGIAGRNRSWACAVSFVTFGRGGASVVLTPGGAATKLDEEALGRHGSGNRGRGPWARAT